MVKPSGPKPGTVTIIGVLEVLTGLIFGLGGTALLTVFGGGFLILYYFGIIHLAIAISFIAVGGGSLLGKRWAWKSGLAISVISVIDDLVAFAVAPLPFDGEVGTAVVLVTTMMAIYFLGRKEVRLFFKKT
jgi:hypothetical protein